VAVGDRESLMGLRLFDAGDVTDALPEALSVSLPDPTGEWT
jgi:phage tail protein X